MSSPSILGVTRQGGLREQLAITPPRNTPYNCIKINRRQWYRGIQEGGRFGSVSLTPSPCYPYTIENQTGGRHGR